MFSIVETSKFDGHQRQKIAFVFHKYEFGFKQETSLPDFVKIGPIVPELKLTELKLEIHFLLVQSRAENC